MCARRGLVHTVAVACAAIACSGASGVGAREPVSAGAGDLDASGLRDASLEARVANAEVAWLVAHLADEPELANPRDSDAVRRLSLLGADGVLAVAEVFRVGDPRRLPFARRVVERVATRRCHRDAARAAWVITRVEMGAAPTAPGDAGIIWQAREDRWPNAAVERLRAWGREGAPCDTPAAGDAGRGADADGG